MQKIITVVLLMLCAPVYGQVRFSFCTDVMVIRNLDKAHESWAIGQTVQANFHFNPRQAAYAWLSYSLPGRFENSFAAEAVSPSVNPQVLPYEVRGRMSYNIYSLGLKQYLKGSYDAETGWNLYATGGFGLLAGKIANTLSTAIDTALYKAGIPVEGEGKFKRLTLDLGLGLEFPVASGFYIYSDLRTPLLLTDYPSPFLHRRQQAPQPLMVSGGLRILFDY
ncbi:MAG TPA: hypothetical protein VFR58_03670 [Flavisolibacter sp.]|nr:hypothetical protein [Flavisolibacter sp.]